MPAVTPVITPSFSPLSRAVKNWPQRSALSWDERTIKYICVDSQLPPEPLHVRANPLRDSKSDVIYYRPTGDVSERTAIPILAAAVIISVDEPGLARCCSPAVKGTTSFD
jgi:hypothetical protein